MNSNRIDAICDDLLTRKPKGEEGEVVTYEDYEEYCYDAHKEKKYVRCDHDGWGYSAETLFQLGFGGSGDVERYVCQRYYDGQNSYSLTSGQKAGVTRKTRRIWGRIESEVRRVKSEGRTGIYRINQGYYSNVLGTVFANDHDDARQVADMFYGYLMTEDAELRTEFIKMGGIEEIQSANQKAVEEIQEQVVRTENRIKEQQEDIARKRMQIDAIQMLQMHTLSQMTRYTPDELLEEDTHSV
jgi:hypothetical protein